MINEHHDLHHEFPEHREQIHTLKTTNTRFAKLFNEYHEVTNEVEKMGSLAETVCSRTEEEFKLKRLQLKDQLFAMLQKA